MIRPGVKDVSEPRAGVVLGLAAIAGSDVPATALDVTDPCEWDLDSWASDTIPHLAYGLVTAVSYDALDTR